MCPHSRMPASEHDALDVKQQLTPVVGRWTLIVLVVSHVRHEPPHSDTVRVASFPPDEILDFVVDEHVAGADMLRGGVYDLLRAQLEVTHQPAISLASPSVPLHRRRHDVDV